MSFCRSKTELFLQSPSVWALRELVAEIPQWRGTQRRIEAT